MFQDQVLKTCKSVQDSSVELYEKQNSNFVLTPIRFYVFGLSFLLTLDI